MRRTLLANLEQLVCIPAYDAALKPAPAPFYDAGEDLGSISTESMIKGRTTCHGLSHAQLLRQELATQRLAAIKEVADEGTDSTRIRRRTEWQKQEGVVESWTRADAQVSHL